MSGRSGDPRAPGRSRVRFGRFLWALVLSGSFAGVLFATLAATVPNLLDVQMAPAETGWQPRVVPLIETGGPPPPVYVAWLRMDEPEQVIQHDEIRILFATSGARIPVEWARLEVLGTRCAYEAASGATLRDNETLAFVRGPHCNPMREKPTGELRLSMELGARGPVAIWTTEPPTGVTSRPSGAVEVEGFQGASGPFPLLRGHYIDHLPGPGARRIELLQYLWGLGRSSARLWTIIAVAVLLMLVGILMASGVANVVHAGGIACLAGGLALVWAVVMPPLQAADEPDHFLSLGPLIGRDFSADVLTLAARTHLSRLAFHADERFRPFDRDRPDSTPLTSDVHAEDTVRRSPVTALFWQSVVGLLGLRQAPPLLLLLSLRIGAALVFAAFAGFAVLMTGMLHGQSGARSALAGLAIVPTIPYFATMQSEWALFVSIAVVWTAAVVALSDDGPRASWGGVLLGGSFGLLVAASVAALPLLPLLFALLGTRLLLGSRRSANPDREAIVFWGGLAAGLMVGVWAAVPAFSRGYYREDAAGMGLQLTSAVNTVVGPIAAHPWLLVAIVAFAGLEIVCGRFRARYVGLPALGRVVSRAAVAVALAVVVVAAGSLAIRLPLLPTFEERNFPGAAAYARAVATVVVTGLRLTQFDHLTFTTFWSGFGWLDTILPPWLLTVFSGGTAVAALVLIGRLVRAGDVRRLLWTASVLVGTVGSLLAYGVAGFGLHRNIHGRYLIGLYLPVVAVVWRGVGEWLDLEESGPAGARLRFLMGAAVIGIHAYCVAFVLNRYF